MSPKNLLVLIGATGTQRSSVVNTFISEPQWRLRGLTRSKTSHSAQTLHAKGVEMVAADVNDPAPLVSAFSGASAIYAHPFLDPANQAKVKPGQTINEWSYEHELQQAKNIIDAAARSGLSAAKKWSGGKYTWVYYYDSKADATKYVEDNHPDLWKKTSVINVGQYLSNHLSLPILKPKKNPEGVDEVTINCPPSAKWPYIATNEDTGRFVKALLSVPAGKNLVAYRALMSPKDFTELWGKLNNVPARLRQVSFDEVAVDPGMGREGAESYAYVGEFGHEAWEDKTVIHPKDLGLPVSLPSVEDWIKAQDWSGILEA